MFYVNTLGGLLTLLEKIFNLRNLITLNNYREKLQN